MRFVEHVEKICIKTGLSKVFERDVRLRETMERLHPGERPNQWVLRTWCTRISMILGGLLGVLSLFLCLCLVEPESILQKGNQVRRGREEEEHALQVRCQDPTGKEWMQTMTFVLEERKLTSNEQKELEGKVDTYLNDRMDAGQRPSEWEDTGVSFTWEKEDDQWKVVAKRSNWEKTYYFDCKKVTLSAEQQQKNQVRKAIYDAMSSQDTNEIVTLPEEIQGVRVTYKDPKAVRDYSPVVVIALVVALCPFLWREQLKRKEEARRTELLCDYPEFVNRMVLLLGAGMTVTGALNRMVQEQQKKGEMHYVYQETQLALWQMERGTTQVRAIEELGKRCQLIPYVRFATVVSQNLKKGSAGILNILQEDAASSFEQRKELVKRMGEKASTKLLLPMLLMLALVMALIMIPAFMTL